jgi:hypothetical protein
LFQFVAGVLEGLERQNFVLLFYLFKINASIASKIYYFSLIAFIHFVAIYEFEANRIDFLTLLRIDCYIFYLLLKFSFFFFANQAHAMGVCLIIRKYLFEKLANFEVLRLLYPCHSNSRSLPGIFCIHAISTS